MELGEELYKDDKITVECRALEDYMDNYIETNEPLFTKIHHDCHIYLGFGYML